MVPPSTNSALAKVCRRSSRPWETDSAQRIVACYDVVKKLQQAQEDSEYQIVKLVEVAKG